MKKSELTFAEVQALVRKADLKKEGFSHEMYFFAFIYVKIFWCLANVFSNGRCEITHNEYALHRIDRKELFICLDLFDENHIHEFGRFIAENMKLLPLELRNMFDVWVGFNYRNDGGFTVKEDSVIFMSQEVYDQAESEGILTDEIIDRETYRSLSSLTTFLFEAFEIRSRRRVS